MSAIKTILFDMGNVLVFFSHERMCRQIGELCGRSPENIRELLMGSDLQWNFERGRLTEEEFCESLSERVRHEFELDALREAASDIFVAHDEIEPILRGLKQNNYRLVLLSNTSISHFNWIQDRYNILEHFDDFTVSYEADAIKPEPGIYHRALSMIQCAPHECFYTDDIAEYVEAGRQHGLQAEVFLNAESLKTHLRERDVRFE
ncbi:MAG: HAD family phosphatase [Planctomycetaceae bacterium]